MLVVTRKGNMVTFSVVNIDGAVVASVASVEEPIIVATSATMLLQESGLCSISFLLKYLKRHDILNKAIYSIIH